MGKEEKKGEEAEQRGRHRRKTETTFFPLVGVFFRFFNFLHLLTGAESEIEIEKIKGKKEEGEKEEKQKEKGEK